MKPFWLFAAICTSCLTAVACAPAESRNANTADDQVIGIVQCDDYLAKVAACIRTVPHQRRETLTAETRQMFATWKEAAADPRQRTTLPQACSVTHEVAKEELAVFGCSM